MLTNQNRAIIKLETVAGTRVEPTATDNDIEFFAVGKPTVDFGLNTDGELGNGTFQKGPTTTGHHTITMPDLTFLVNRPAGIGTTPEKWSKVAKLTGAEVTTVTGQSAIVWDAKGSGYGGSVDFTHFEGQSQTTYKGRGMRGTLTLGWEGSNAAWRGTVNGLRGAYVGEVNGVRADLALTGNDTAAPEKAAYYVITIGGTVYQCHTFQFAVNNVVGIEGANSESGVVRAKDVNSDLKITMSLTALNGPDSMLEYAKNSTYFATIGMAGATGAGYDGIIEDAVLTATPSFGDSDGTVTWEVELNCKKFGLVQKAL